MEEVPKGIKEIIKQKENNQIRMVRLFITIGYTVIRGDEENPRKKNENIKKSRDFLWGLL